jgi:uncharacterized protein YabE (DUF348 family)
MDCEHVKLVCSRDGKDGQRIAVGWLCKDYAEWSDWRRELEQQGEIGLKHVTRAVVQVDGLDFEHLSIVQNAPEEAPWVCMVLAKEQ